MGQTDFQKQNGIVGDSEQNLRKIREEYHGTSPGVGSNTWKSCGTRLMWDCINSSTQTSNLKHLPEGGVKQSQAKAEGVCTVFADSGAQILGCSQGWCQ